MNNPSDYQHGVKDLPLPLPTVLLVEDEADMRRNLTELLGDKFKILSSATAKEALSLYEREQANIDLVLLDIRLPDGNGIDVLKKMKKISLRPDIIIVTAINDLETSVSAMKLGAYDYITKPFFADDILGTVRRAMEKKDYTRKLSSLSEALEKERIAWQRRQILLKEMEMKRRLEGKKLSPEEMLLFDFPFSPEEYEFKQFKEKLEAEVGQKLEESTERSSVLCVEDEADMRANLKELLEPYFTVHLAANGAEARASILKFQPDVVLLDIRLPDANGIELIPELLQLHPGCDIILVTALRDVENGVKGMKSGAYDYVTKPFYSADLISTIERVLEKRRHRKIIDSLLKKLEDQKISPQNRLKMLQELLDQRSSAGKNLTMEDIFCFFPEYQDIDLDPSFSLPDFPSHITLENFLEKLKLRKEERERNRKAP